MQENLLSIITFLPLIAAAMLAIFVRGDDEVARQNARNVALWATLFTCFISGFILAEFDPSDPGFQLIENRDWIFGLSYQLGVDGISVPLVLMTTSLMVLLVLASGAIKARLKEYMIALLAFESLMVGTLVSLDLLLFVICYSALLIPIWLMIGIWGGRNRAKAGMRFLIYGLVGVLPLLIAALMMQVEAGTSELPALINHSFTGEGAEGQRLGQRLTSLPGLLWLALIFGFAMRLPIWPLSGWFTDANAEAPLPGSILLLVLMIKTAAYGMLRVLLPIFPELSAALAPVMLWLAVAIILYGGLVALVQDDMKRLIGYLSLSQMGFVLIGIFSLNQQGLEGAVLGLIAHGLIAFGLLTCVGWLEGRRNTREIAAFGGLLARMPVFTFTFVFFALMAMGLPGGGWFVAEFLVLMGAFSVSGIAAGLAGLGLVLAAGYLMSLCRRVVFGDLIKEGLKSIEDLKWSERLLALPLILAVLLIGIWPGFVTELYTPTIEALLFELSEAVAEAAPVAGE